jgi:hypothetical protein
MDLKWIEDFNKQTIYAYNDDSEDGYTIEVTTRIPQDKHELFNDYPPIFTLLGRMHCGSAFL